MTVTDTMCRKLYSANKGASRERVARQIPNVKKQLLRVPVLVVPNCSPMGARILAVGLRPLVYQKEQVLFIKDAIDRDKNKFFSLNAQLVNAM